MVQKISAKGMPSFFVRHQAIILGVVVIALYVFLGWQHIHDPFIHVSEDTNGSNGMAAYNWYRFGIKDLKGGLVVHWLPEQDFLNGKIVYYADHPSGFLLPTYFAYKLFGIHEWTTRVGPLSLVVLGLILFYGALLKIFQDPAKAFLSILGFVLLPGSVYYGKHLDMQSPALGWALITFSLFIFYYYRQNRTHLAAFLISAIIGCFVAWHYYFILLGIWLVVLFGKFGKTIIHRKAILIGLPIIVTTGFLVNLLHIYTLGGWEALQTLRGSFFNRSGGIFIFASKWYKDVWSRFDLNVTWYWMLAACAGGIVFIRNQVRAIEKELLAPIWIMPVGVILVFQSWSTHPFGPIYFLPIIGVFIGILCFSLLRRFRVYGAVLTIIIIVVGGMLSIQKLNFFYQDFLILSQVDINLLTQRIAPSIKDKELCVGQNDFGLYYGGIIGWYIHHQPLFSPQCFEENGDALGFGLLFRGPREFYQQEAQRFLGTGFKLDPNDCAGLWCLVTRSR
ncbi:MAG: hypothetical protein UX65_C0001G0031 [Parcubacteria group bacterium GW2011_GWB1_46_8]|nr:MAG: hypothetical protein UX14_C0003G0031 [Parcubacteria group bacterium GW2011_GWF1_45_5]KKU43567.1 MAG: hypothetical protein UX61_C0016G0019 [Parcubacteria group bacterium GW2011_GWA2_46_7]KKU46637.1 MAG: hypothetical protein UX65_C0001G0031 [Parcubacteria group bacterium GW2011_GWB1_46_8]KKU47797.1 MAG: hypothetical protein UX66_C0005G0019 [Parcubacteria group bacterium GW2011_GWF2_46_8]